MRKTWVGPKSWTLVTVSQPENFLFDKIVTLEWWYTKTRQNHPLGVQDMICDLGMTALKLKKSVIRTFTAAPQENFLHVLSKTGTLRRWQHSCTEWYKTSNHGKNINSATQGQCVQSSGTHSDSSSRSPPWMILSAVSGSSRSAVSRLKWFLLTIWAKSLEVWGSSP